jgi:O-antigen/teichoic acid export membrane protein
MLKGLWKKYKDLSLVVKASLWFMFCSLIQKSMSLITTPIFTRIMDTEQYGLYSTYLSILTIATVIITLNFDTCAYMNGISKFHDEKEKNRLAVSLLSLTTFLAIVGFVVVFFFNDILSNVLSMPKELLYIMILEILFIPPIKFWMVQQRFAYRYVSQVCVNLGMLLTNNILGVFFVLAIPNRQALMRVISVVLVQAIVGSIIFIDYLRKGGYRQITKYWGYGLRLNLPLIPHGLSLMLLSSSDRVMINAMIGSLAAAIYGVAYSAGQLINTLKISLVDSIRPWIYEKLQEKKYNEIKDICKLIFLLNVMLTFIIVGLAPEIIRVLAPAKYFEAIYIIPPVAASSYFTFIYNICSIVELYYEKNRNVMLASMVAAVANVVLNFAFIPVFGYLAAGYTTLVSYMLLSLMHFIFVDKIRKEEMEGYRIFDVRFIVVMSCVVLLVMILFTVVYSNPVIRLSMVFGIALCCFIMRKKFLYVLSSVKRKKKKVE